jgi:hypothetical protein
LDWQWPHGKFCFDPGLLLRRSLLPLEKLNLLFHTASGEVDVRLADVTDGEA